jgi:PAS domain S-box-containing protein
VIGAGEVTSDITELMEAQQALAEREEQLRLFIEHAPAALAMFDREMRYIAHSSRWIHDFRPGSQDLLGRCHYDVFPDLPQRWRDAHRRGLAGETVRAEEDRYEHEDGTVLWVHWEVRPWHTADGAVGGIVVFTEDITERKRSEEILRETDRRKTEFLAVLAHELRNPLAPIRNAAHILRLKGQPDPALRTAQEMIDRQVAHMVRLIDDLLDVSRISRGQLQLRKERVELAAVLEQAIESARPHLDRAAHALTLSLPPQPIYLDADPVRLTQVFLNLLDNAAKYTERGGRIALTAELDGTEAVVTVSDNGIGIPQEHLSGIFEMFSRVGEGLKRCQGALGIGLALTKCLVQMHDGSIEARSEGVGRGSELIVRLPAIAGPTATAASSGTAHHDSGCRSAPLRILVADDNRDGAESLAMMLAGDGNQVETAYDGLQAVEAAARFRPDVILLDIGMPMLDGYGACRRIREHSGAKRPLIYAVSGWGQEGDRRASQEAGFDGHLVKPIDPSALLELLAESRPGRS